VFATPAAASNSASARRTCRCGAVCDRAIPSRASRCPSDMTRAAAGVITPEAYFKSADLFWRHTTSSRNTGTTGTASSGLAELRSVGSGLGTYLWDARSESWSRPTACSTSGRRRSRLSPSRSSRSYYLSCGAAQSCLVRVRAPRDVPEELHVNARERRPES
jgi:hypothetical protein